MAPPKKISLLLIDDDGDQLEMEQLYLSDIDKKYCITTACSAQESLNLIGDNKFDCIVCDQLMPGMKGLDLCSKLRKQGDTTPFILFTARGSEEIAEKAFITGVDMYMRKAPDPSIYHVLDGHIKNLVTNYRIISSRRTTT